jgi:hypothetical protein
MARAKFSKTNTNKTIPEATRAEPGSLRPEPMRLMPTG